MTTHPPSRRQTLERLETTGIVAVVRARKPEALGPLALALVEGGVEAVELTMTSPGALEAAQHIHAELGERCLLGIGSVLDAETARLAILAGADFIVSPILSPPVIETAHRYGKVVIPGALSPTEILTAWQAGADVVKVFPANHFGPGYFRDLLAPMPQLRLTPTGGVELSTVRDWFAAGAVCLGVGSSLVKRELVEGESWRAITDLARRFREAADEARR